MSTDPSVCVTRLKLDGQSKGVPSVQTIASFLSSAPILEKISNAIKPSYIRIEAISANLHESLIRKTPIYNVKARLDIEKGFEGDLPYLFETIHETHVTENLRGVISGHIRSGKASEWARHTTSGW